VSEDYADLLDEQLDGVDLANARLRKASWRGVEIRGARLRSCELADVASTA
jgi:uncharacterized protein YjbI with pentapeptide repeats